MGKRRAQALKTRDADALLELYPNMRQWINECVRCHHKGLRGDAPQADWPPVYRSLHQHFDLLKLDENGLCEQCGTSS